MRGYVGARAHTPGDGGDWRAKAGHVAHFATAAVLVLATAAVVVPKRASACGGLFCNSQATVNQTAERILFVDHGNGFTTAAIEIKYQGEAERFAWLLPVGNIINPSIDIRVSSGRAFDNLQQATDPRYVLNRRVEGVCATPPATMPTRNSATPNDLAGPPSNEPMFAALDGGVWVEASGSAGPYDYELISVLPFTPDPAQAVVDWLEVNGYDLGIGDEVLRPYLMSGMRLLAVRLTKGNSIGSIRPLVVTYQGSQPSIPIRPTAVAAADDMGIMVFIGGRTRAVPKNYKLLHLNDALINWFNPGSSYGAVVTAAAGEAGGQGFVTEYAGNSAQVPINNQEQGDYLQYGETSFDTSQEAFRTAIDLFGTMDGFITAAETGLTVPDGITATDIFSCFGCMLDDPNSGVTLDRDAFHAALGQHVIDPITATVALAREQPYFTRLYTTMSAEDMTEDPIFDFNPDLGDHDNIHMADQIIECSAEYYERDAPYRIELPSGLIVYGTTAAAWPASVAELPGALSIEQAGISGPTQTMVDNFQLVQDALDMMRPERRPLGFDPAAPLGTDPTGGGQGGSAAAAVDAGQSAANGGPGGDDEVSCGCRAVGTHARPLPALSWLLGLMALRLTRRRRRRALAWLPSQAR